MQDPSAAFTYSELARSRARAFKRFAIGLKGHLPGIGPNRQHAAWWRTAALRVSLGASRPRIERSIGLGFRVWCLGRVALAPLRGREREVRLEMNLRLERRGCACGTFPVHPFPAWRNRSARCDGFLSQKANILEAPFLAQPRSADHFQDFFERRIRIRDLGRAGHVLHEFPHMPEVFPRSFWPECLP